METVLTTPAGPEAFTVRSRRCRGARAPDCIARFVLELPGAEHGGRRQRSLRGGCGGPLSLLCARLVWGSAAEPGLQSEKVEGDLK